MTRENATVTAERARLANEFEAGQQEGFDAPADMLPVWYFDKPVVRLTARQRGYVFGKLLKEWEKGQG